jgi:hypothetical protein
MRSGWRIKMKQAIGEQVMNLPTEEGFYLIKRRDDPVSVVELTSNNFFYFIADECAYGQKDMQSLIDRGYKIGPKLEVKEF